MAKAKNCRKTYVSKGERNNVSRATVGLMRRSKTEGDKLMNKLRAWKAGKNPKVFNGEKKVPANDYWGDYRNSFFDAKSGKAEKTANV